MSALDQTGGFSHATYSSSGTNYNPVMNHTGNTSLDTPMTGNTVTNGNTTNGFGMNTTGNITNGTQGSLTGSVNGNGSVNGKQHDLISMGLWNRDTLTTFPTGLQYYESYSKAYGWVQKLKELAFLSDLFREIDQDRSGFIDKDEFTVFATNPTTKKIFATRFGFQPHQQSTIFSKISGGEEQISYSAWVQYLYALMKKTSGQSQQSQSGGLEGPTQEFMVFERDRREHEAKIREANQRKEWLNFKPLKLPSKGGRIRCQDNMKNNSSSNSVDSSTGPSWHFKMLPARTICNPPTYYSVSNPNPSVLGKAGNQMINNTNSSPNLQNQMINSNSINSVNGNLNGINTESSSPNLIPDNGQSVRLGQLRKSDYVGIAGSSPLGQSKENNPEISKRLKSIKTQPNLE